MKNGEEFFINHPIFLKYKNRFSIQKLRSERYLKSVHINERIIETPFVIQSLASLPKGSAVLDLGCTESALPLYCAGLGYQVTGFDFREYPYRHPNLKFVSGDLTKLPFEKNSFDAVLAVSTIEHVGIGFYDDPQEVEAADKKAIEEAQRVLKTGGLLTITVPFGRSTTSDHQRVYDLKALKDLLKAFKIEEIRFFKSVNLPEKINTWVETSAEEAVTVDSSKKTEAVALIRCHKS